MSFKTDYKSTKDEMMAMKTKMTKWLFSHIEIRRGLGVETDYIHFF